MSAENVSGSGLRDVKKWLEKHPRAAREVTLSVKSDDGEELLQSWEVGELTPMMAATMLEAVEQYAQAAEHDVVAPIKWLTKDGKLLQTRLIRRKYARAEEPVQHSMTGSLQDQAAQAQRHTEKVMQMAMAAVSGAMQQMFRLSEATMQLCERIADGKATADVEVQRLREELQEVVVTTAEDAVASAKEQAEKAGEDAPSPIEAVAAAVIPLLPRLVGTPPGPVAEVPKGGG